MRCRAMALAGVVLVLGGSLACEQDREPQQRLGVRYRLFFDQTGSIPEAQRRRWRQIFVEDFLGLLQPSDRLEIFAIHDRTQESGPLQVVELPSLPVNAGLGPTMLFSRALKQARESATKTVDSLLTNEVAAASTSVLGTIDLFSPDTKGRPTRMIYFSDMLESANSESNLERIRLTEENTGKLVERVVRLRGWKKDRLQDVQVYCLIRTYQAGNAAPLNSRVMLRSFWGAIFSRLGAELAQFDTHLNIPASAGVQGPVPPPARPVRFGRFRSPAIALEGRIDHPPSTGGA